MRILLLDVETAPNLAHVWGLWNQNVGIGQIMEAGYTMCWSAKWLDEDKVIYDSLYKSKPKKMLKGIHRLLDEADVVIHYNGTKFDIPTLNKEFVIHGMLPPSPYKQVDLLKVVRSKFRFPSNKLDYVSRALGLGKKVEHKGHELWIQCMANEPDAWEKMEEYNINDVILLESLYYRILPWISNHPNYNYHSTIPVCPNCGGTHLHKRGVVFGLTDKQRYQCQDCGKWSQERLGTKNKNVELVGCQ